MKLFALVIAAAMLFGCNRNLAGDYIGPSRDYEPRPVVDERTAEAPYLWPTLFPFCREEPDHVLCS